MSKYLLSIFVLLLSLSGSLSAHSYKKSNLGRYSQEFNRKLNSGVFWFKGNESPETGVVLFDSEKQNDDPVLPLFENEEEEDYESSLSENHLELTGHTSALFLFSFFEQFYNSSKRVLPPHHFFSHTISGRYLVFNSFRI